LPDLKTKDAADWWDYSHALPKEGLLPPRSALNPGEVLHLLPNMIVHDMSAPPAVKFRLAGTVIVERYGFNPTGTDFLDLLEESTRERNSALLHAAARHPFGVLSTLQARYGNGLLADVETLSLPFSDGPDAAPQLVTVSVRISDRSRLDDDPGSPNRVAAASVELVDLGAGVPSF